MFINFPGKISLKNRHSKIQILALAAGILMPKTQEAKSAETKRMLRN